MIDQYIEENASMGKTHSSTRFTLLMIMHEQNDGSNDGNESTNRITIPMQAPISLQVFATPIAWPSSSSHVQHGYERADIFRRGPVDTKDRWGIQSGGSTSAFFFIATNEAGGRTRMAIQLFFLDALYC